MDASTVAILGFITLFTLMLLRVPVGMAMGLVGVSGFAYLVGTGPAFKIVGHTSMRTVTDYTFGVIPMFLLMGAFVTNSGMSQELFRAANAFLGHRKGGLGIATIAACGGFAAISGSSVATAATFSAVAYPEMRRYGYPQSFATGVIAASGTITQLIPPSLVLVVLADQLGFRDVWISEHHGEPVYIDKVDTLPIPELLMCRAASVTKNIRMGAAVKLLHLAHPLDIALQAAITSKQR
mgnify:CR=1 FL=1